MSLDSDDLTENKPLLVGEDGQDGEPHPSFVSAAAFARGQSRHKSLLVGTIIVQTIISAVILGGGWWVHHMQSSSSLQLVYSPLNEAAPFEVRRWNVSLGDLTTEFMGTSDDVDTRWKELFMYGIDRLSQDEVQLLTEPTSPLPLEPGYYMITFEVFHQLHCVNMLRKRIHPEHYPLPTDPSQAHAQEKHLDHCIDTLRQTLSCTVDINPIAWEWNEEQRKAFPKLDGLHECRNWDSIWEWSREHRVRKPFHEKASM